MCAIPAKPADLFVAAWPSILSILRMTNVDRYPLQKLTGALLKDMYMLRILKKTQDASDAMKLSKRVKSHLACRKTMMRSASRRTLSGQ